jgi:hypothetical protein
MGQLDGIIDRRALAPADTDERPVVEHRHAAQTTRAAARPVATRNDRLAILGVPVPC